MTNKNTAPEPMVGRREIQRRSTGLPRHAVGPVVDAAEVVDRGETGFHKNVGSDLAAAAAAAVDEKGAAFVGHFLGNTVFKDGQGKVFRAHNVASVVFHGFPDVENKNARILHLLLGFFGSDGFKSGHNGLRTGRQGAEGGEKGRTAEKVSHVGRRMKKETPLL